jgi:hypothetical protein
MDILSRIPHWVWPLLIALIVVGWRQTRSRTLPRRRLVLLTLALNLYALLSLGLGLHGQALLWPALCLWALSNLVLSLSTRRCFAPAIEQNNQSVTVPGSFWPLALYLSIFSLRFVHGVWTGIHPEAATQAQTVLTLAALSGALSGLINARSLRLLQVRQESV